MHRLIMLVVIALALIPAASGGAPAGREVQVVYVTAQYAGAYLGDDGASVSLVEQGRVDFHFEPGETAVSVVVEDVTTAPIGGSWLLISHGHEVTYSLRGYFCESFDVSLPEVPGERTWHLVVQLFGFPGGNSCSFVPPPSTAGTITATFT